MIHFGFSNLALSNADGTAKWTKGDAFSSVQSSSFYWSSTTLAVNPDIAWHVFPNGGFTGTFVKGSAGLVWPVQGGQ